MSNTNKAYNICLTAIQMDKNGKLNDTLFAIVKAMKLDRGRIAKDIVIALKNKSSQCVEMDAESKAYRRGIYDAQKVIEQVLLNIQ